MKKMIIITIILSALLLGVIIFLANWDWDRPVNSDPVEPPIPNTEQGILNAEDFYFINRDRNYIVWLGMEKSDFLLSAGSGRRPWVDYGRDHEWEDIPRYYYIAKDSAFNLDANRLVAISSIGAGEFTYDADWETYKGINPRSTKEDVLEIFGQPTHMKSATNEINGLLFYVYNRADDGKYYKVESLEKMEELLTNPDYAENLKAFIFWYEYNSNSNLSMWIEYLYLGSGWRHFTNIGFPEDS